MKKLIGSWSFYKKTLTIAIPVMIQNLITNFVALIDNIMVGQVGTEQMSGVAIVNQLFFVFTLTAFGAVSGVGIFTAQFFGKKDNDGVRYTLRFKIIIATLVTLIGIGIFVLFGDSLIMKFLHDNNDGIDIMKTFEYAYNYMLIMLVGLIPFNIEQSYSGTLREGGIAVPPMIAGVIAVITNTLLNYLLIFGIGIFPKMGVTGAAIATVISRYIQALIVIIWSHSNTHILPYIKGLYRSLKVPFSLIKSITIKGVIPLTINECMWSAGVTMLTQCYSLRGINVVAGLNIANTVINLFNVLFIAFGSGISVVIGQMLGANQLKEAKEGAPKLIFFSGAMCVVIGAVMACFSKVFPLAYNTTNDIRTLASQFILITAATMPIHGTLHATYFTLRSGGKTLLTFLYDCGFSWLISVPVAYILSYFTNVNIIYIYLTCQLLEFAKCSIGLIFIKKGIWISNIVS